MRKKKLPLQLVHGHVWMLSSHAWPCRRRLQAAYLHVCAWLKACIHANLGVQVVVTELRSPCFTPAGRSTTAPPPSCLAMCTSSGRRAVP